MAGGARHGVVDRGPQRGGGVWVDGDVDDAAAELRPDRGPVHAAVDAAEQIDGAGGEAAGPGSHEHDVVVVDRDHHFDDAVTDRQIHIHARPVQAAVGGAVHLTGR